MSVTALPGRGARPAPRRQRGLALVVVLWTITLLAVIAANFAYSRRIDTNLAGNTVARTKARYLAQAGIQRALLAMLDPDPQARWPADGTAWDFEMAGATIRVSVRDERAFIDLNRAPPPLLDGLLRLFGVDDARRQALTDAIADWRDGDSLRQASGAEDDDYARAGLAYGAKDGPFEAVEELQLVLGMTPSLYQAIEPFLTVHGNNAAVNLAAAPREVLLASPGMDPASVDQLLADRAAGRETGRRGAAAGGTVRIIAAATLPSGVGSAIRVVVQLAPGAPARPVTVLAWKEGV